MNDDALKNIWKTENTQTSVCVSSEIEKFMSGNSKNVAQTIRKMYYMDLGMKLILASILFVEIILYIGASNVLITCIFSIVLILILGTYQLKLLKRFSQITDYGQNTREKLTAMLAYLKTSFLSTLINISVTYVFFFIAGTLGYFYFTYGFVRKLDLQDIVVFSGFILLGITINFVVNKGLVKQQIHHLESSLDNLNDKALSLATEQIKSEKRLDRKNKFLLSLALLTGFLMLVTLFSNLQF